MNERILKELRDTNVNLSDEDIKKILTIAVNECVSVMETIDTYEDDKRFLSGFMSAKNAGIRLIKLKFEIGG